MISTSWRPRTRRVLIAALVLSVLIHLFGGAAYDYGRHLLLAAHLLREPVPKKNPNDFVATSDVIHIEKRAVPRRTNPQRPAPRPAAPSRAEPRIDPQLPALAVPQLDPEKPVARAETPRPLETRPPELAHETHKAAPRLAEEKTGGIPDATPEPKPETVERQAPRAQRKPTERKTAQFSPQQIATLESQFQKTIQSSREDLSSVVDQTKEPVGGPKHYAMNMSGIQSNLTRGQGTMRPVSATRLDRMHTLYVVRYEYMYPDGHIESDVIPWPFIYPVYDDPFARGDKILHFQLPPPTFHPRRPLTPQEQIFYDAAQAQSAGAP